MRVAVAVVLAGCGRIGFDERGAVVDAAACAAYSRLALDRVVPAEQLDNFPLPIILDDARADRTLIDTTTLRILDETGAALPQQIEQLGSRGGEPTVVWVRVPEILDASVVLTACYGGRSPPPAPNTAVWTDSFLAVWHLTGDATDATPPRMFPHDGTVTEAVPAPGLIGGAFSFSRGGANTFIRIPPAPDIGEPPQITISGWMYERTPDADGYDALIARQSSGAYNELYLGTTFGTGYAALGAEAGYVYPFGNVTPLQRWNYFALTYDGAEVAFYQDDGAPARASVTGTIQYVGNPYFIGGDRDGAAGGPADCDFLDGLVDEVRIQRVARSAAWLAYDYAAGNDAVISYGPVVRN